MKKLFEQVYGRKLDYFEEIKYSLPLYLQDGKKATGFTDDNIQSIKAIA